MTEPDLIGYLLNALDPDDCLAVESSLRASPEAAARLEQLRLALSPLDVERDECIAPAGLADRTIARLATHLAKPETKTPVDPLSIIRTVVETVDPWPEALSSPTPRAPRESLETRSLGGRFRPDLIVACAIAFVACGIVLSAVGKVRARSQLLACQANLQTLYAGLVGYADTHDGRYPQVGPDSTADSFAAALADAGQVPADFQAGCPAIAAENEPTSYTYTLGFQSPLGGLVGLRRPEGPTDENDLLPIAADYPTASAAPAAGSLCAHPPVMNVLCIGGNVRSTTSPLIGPNGDDIYRNLHGQVAAGVDRFDVRAGRPGDRP